MGRTQYNGRECPRNRNAQSLGVPRLKRLNGKGTCLPLWSHQFWSIGCPPLGFDQDLHVLPSASRHRQPQRAKHAQLLRRPAKAKGRACEAAHGLRSEKARLIMIPKGMDSRLNIALSIFGGVWSRCSECPEGFSDNCELTHVPFVKVYLICGGGRRLSEADYFSRYS